jgi:hypothetical protein
MPGVHAMESKDAFCQVDTERRNLRWAPSSLLFDGRYHRDPFNRGRSEAGRPKRAF